MACGLPAGRRHRILRRDREQPRRGCARSRRSGRHSWRPWRPRPRRREQSGRSCGRSPAAVAGRQARRAGVRPADHRLSAVRLFVLVRHGQSELNATQRVNGDPTVRVGADGAGRGRGGRPRRPARRVSSSTAASTHVSAARRETAWIALAGRDVPDRGRAAARRHRRRRARRPTRSRLPRLEARAHAPMRSRAARASMTAARRYADAYERLLARRRAAHPRRLPRDPGPLRRQRSRRLGRARRPRARDPQLRSAPLRRGRPLTRRRAHPSARLESSPRA